MKKFIFLFIILFSFGCDQNPNDVSQNLAKDILGNWEAIEFRESGWDEYNGNKMTYDTSIVYDQYDRHFIVVDDKFVHFYYQNTNSVCHDHDAELYLLSGDRLKGTAESGNNPNIDYWQDSFEEEGIVTGHGALAGTFTISHHTTIAIEGNYLTINYHYYTEGPNYKSAETESEKYVLYGKKVPPVSWPQQECEY